MNLSELHRKLISAARATPPDERVPYAFEMRIMAHLSGKHVLDPWSLWGRALSRAAIYSVAFMLVLSAGSYFAPSSSNSTTIAGNTETLSQDVEQTLFAAVENNADSEPN
jgi:hypothetical protein